VLPALLLLAACASSPPPAPAAPAPAAAAPAERFEMKKYFVAFLRRGPAWTAERTPESIRHGEGHMAHIDKMARAGKLLIAGPFEVDRSELTALAGIYIFDVPTLEEARDLVGQDPAVQAGRFVPEVLPWWGPAGLTYRGHQPVKPR
jgi:uncharacterized protein YciI